MKLSGKLRYWRSTTVFSSFEVSDPFEEVTNNVIRWLFIFGYLIIELANGLNAFLVIADLFFFSLLLLLLFFFFFVIGIKQMDGGVHACPVFF